MQRFRSFNRVHSQTIGLLEHGYLGTDLSIPEARVLYEVAMTPGCTQKDIRAITGIDQGYLSRITRRLVSSGFVRRSRFANDGRAHHLTLTREGKDFFRTLDDRANEQGQALLGHMSAPERRRCAQALDTLQAALSGPKDEPPPVTIRTQRVGDVGWTFYRQAVVYEREFGYSPVFERYVSEGLAPYLIDHDPGRDQLWVAEVRGDAVGFIAIHHVDERPAWAKLRWFLVEKEARGLGIGWKLLTTALDFARGAGYAGVFLWTVDDLDAARRLYERAGFRLAEETDGCPWAEWGSEQRWELEFKGT